MGGESPFFLTARFLSGRVETCNKHISKSLYQFFPTIALVRAVVIYLIHLCHTKVAAIDLDKTAEIDDGKTARFLH
jgi:hypothetical protein